MLTTSKGGYGLPTGFDTARGNRQKAIAFDKENKRPHQCRYLWKDAFGLVEHEKNAAYGLSFKLPLKTFDDSAIVDKVALHLDGKMTITNV